MARVRIVGHRRRLDATLATLYRLRCVQLVDIGRDSEIRLPPLSIDDARLSELEELKYLKARLNGLLRLIPDVGAAGGVEPATALDIAELTAVLDAAAPEVEALVGRLDELRLEQQTLPRHLDALRRLIPLLPDMAELESYEMSALLIDTRHGEVLGELNDRLTTVLGGNFEIISDRLDSQTIGAVLIYPRHAADRVQDQLGREQVSRVRLPERYESMPFRAALTAMEQRVADLDVEIDKAESAVEDCVRAHPDWPVAQRAVTARLDQLTAIRNLGATPHTFVLSGWMPADRVEELMVELEAAIGDEVVVGIVEGEAGEDAPVLLKNPRPAQPYESFVRLFEVPRYRTIDPSLLMLVFVPLFFGMMLGDVAYGAIIFGGALYLRNRFTAPGFLHDLMRLLVLSGAWSILWGFVYGEFFGDLGQRWFGMEPLWINREEAIVPLLVLSVIVGAAHITLGLVLGTVQAVREKSRTRLGEHAGLLIALVGLFVIVAIAADQVPGALTTPAVAAIVVGLVVLVVAGGPKSPLTGPLVFVGTIGNVLSYLRIGAIGLASVYLARVANELGAAAPLLLGILIAALFHALNLVLGVFSPTIQALRLHYVEFFGKFFEGGGQSFHPFGGDGDSVTDTSSTA